MSRNWTGRAAVTFGAWLVIALAAWVLGNQPRPGLLFLMVAVASGLVLLHLDVSADAEVSRWPPLVEEPVRQPGEDPRLERLQRVLDQHRTAHEVGDALHRRLTELADQRLVAHHGVSRAPTPSARRSCSDPSSPRSSGSDRRTPD